MGLRERADEANDSHDHDELHAAAVIEDILEGRKTFKMLTTQDRIYLQRWVEGLTAQEN